MHYMTFDFDIGVNVTRKATEDPLHHVTNAHAKFEVATPNGLGKICICKKHDERTDRQIDRPWYEISTSFFSLTEGDAVTRKYII